MARSPTFVQSNVVLVASHYIASLSPSTLIAQVEFLLEGHKIQDAAELVDRYRKSKRRAPVDQNELDELNYVYQRIGFQCLLETLFEEAGTHLFYGNLDPRILISYFPDIRGSLLLATDSANVFAGIAEHMPKASSIDDMIMNYSPHLLPNTSSAPPTAELRKILHRAAVDMLESFLNQCRAKRRANQFASTSDSEQIDSIVDTVYAKLLACNEKTTKLYALIDEPNGIILDEVEPALTQYGQYNALCKICRQRAEHERLLQVLSKLVEGEWTDDDVQDPLAEMFAFLSEKRERALVQRWGVWLTKKDPQRALKLLTTRESNKRTKVEDDLALLQQIREASPEAGAQFLEYLVLQKRNIDPQLHMELATSCLDKTLAYLSDDSVSKLWRAKASSYSTSRSQSSFLSYFASTTPDSEHKRSRLKTILFLQGSGYLDLEAVHARLKPHHKILQLECAIVEGKLGRHRSALSILADELHDEISAEAYCALGGEIIPSRTAQSIGENHDLRPWPSIILSPMSASKGIVKTKSVDENLRKELLMTLLEVYMSAGEASVERTARLLNTQAMNLDVLEVIPLIPPDWSLNVPSSFLFRSFRRLLHARHEGQIIKALSTGQNLETADKTWLILREQGAIIEEAVDEEDAGGDELLGVDEKSKPLPALPYANNGPESFDEKLVGTGDVVEIRTGGDTGVVVDSIAVPSSVESGMR